MPRPLSKRLIRQIAAEMLKELQQLKLTVIVIPDGRGSHRGIRVVVCPNPDWYSRLCQQYLKRRLNKRWKRPRTIIKRGLVLQHLERITVHGLNSQSIYHERLRDSIEWVASTRFCNVKDESHAKNEETASRTGSHSNHTDDGSGRKPQRRGRIHVA